MKNEWTNYIESPNNSTYFPRKYKAPICEPAANNIYLPSTPTKCDQKILLYHMLDIGHL